MKTQKELRVYVYDCNWEPALDFWNATNEQIMDVCEQQGGVYSLEHFENEWNCENIPYDSFIKFIWV